MLLFELRKIICNKIVILLFIVSILVKVFITCSYTANSNTYFNMFYDEYANDLYGKTPEQKQEILKEEKKWLNNILFSEVDGNKSGTGTTIKEGKLYMEALGKQTPFNIMLKKTENVFKAADLKKAALTGEGKSGLNLPDDFETNNSLYKSATVPDIIPDRGWIFFISISKWYFPVILLLAGLSGVFSGEYESGMHKLLLSTANGHRRLFLHKYAASMIFTAVTVVFFTSLDLAAGETVGNLIGWNAPLRSLDAFYSYLTNMTIGQYIFIYFIINLFAGFCSTGIILFVSLMTGNPYKSLAVGVCIFGLSAFLKAIYPNWGYFSLFGLIDVNRLFAQPYLLRAIGITVPFLFISAVLNAGLFVILFIYAFRCYSIYNSKRSVL